MRLQSLKKWGIGLFFVLIIASIVVITYMLSEVNHILGKHTEVVDTSQFSVYDGKLAITNVHVLAPDGQSMQAHKTVYIAHEKIEAITDSLSKTEGYKIIDGTGQYVIPGLIDAHVHLKNSKNDLLLYLANGITTVGEMTGMSEHFDYLQAIEAGDFLGPDIYIASPKMSSQTSMRATFRSLFERRYKNYTSNESAQKAVRDFKDQGYKAIKLGSDINKSMYYAITEEAKAQNIPVIGHLPVYVGLQDLYQSGQSQLSHIGSIVQAEINAYGDRIGTHNAAAFMADFKEKADSIAIQFRERNISVNSTLWIYESFIKQAFDLEAFLKSIPLSYQNPGWVEGSVVSGGWLPGGGNSYEVPDTASAAYKEAQKAFWEVYIEATQYMTQVLYKHGVHMTAGTDAHGACGAVPGFSFHSELVSLNRVGLPNAAVLQMATRTAAEWMGISTGRIAVGQRADLVLLRNNPLDEMAYTQHIEAVMTNGKWLDRATLDAMLAAVKAANARSRELSIAAFE